jgi:hypothetical protein
MDAGGGRVDGGQPREATTKLEGIKIHSIRCNSSIELTGRTVAGREDSQQKLQKHELAAMDAL